MIKRMALGILVVFTAGMLQAAEFTGFLADEKCAGGGKAGSEKHAGCAKKCIENGQPVVLVSADGKVYKLDKQDEAKAHAGHKVTVKGTASGDTIKVESITM